MRDQVIYLVCTLREYADEIREFQPDILGVGFFSIHFVEVRKLVRLSRQVCQEAGFDTVFIAGGIHASTEPAHTLAHLDFDYVFVGEAEVSLSQFCDGADPSEIQGVLSRDQVEGLEETSANGKTHLGRLQFAIKGVAQNPLDDLPFPDYSLVNAEFYARPNRAKFRTFTSRSLDILMGRGCVYHCSFCAYNALSSVRFHSADYLSEEVKFLQSKFNIDSFYFMDSTIGNNQPLLLEFCQSLHSKKLTQSFRWNGCMRPNQIRRPLLESLLNAGCWHLFYGFESNSQRMLDLMSKGCSVEQNEAAAQLHREMEAPYTASMLMGYPGETEDDILQSIQFIIRNKPPVAGFNWYIPLPGSPDYDQLRAKGLIDREDPMEWRKIGEIASQARVFADVPRERFLELFNYGQALCNKLTHDYGVWGCIAPHEARIDAEVNVPVGAPHESDVELRLG